MQHTTSADGLVGIFEPSILVPAQFFAGLRHKAPAEGERRLMLAILEDAIECFQKTPVGHGSQTPPAARRCRAVVLGRRAGLAVFFCQYLRGV